MRAGDTEHEIAIEAAAPDAPLPVSIDGIVHPLWIGCEGDEVWLGDGRHTETWRVKPALGDGPARAAAAGAAVVAPLTGKVLEVRVNDGEAVVAGQVLLVIESMKMEMRITAPHDGVARALGAAAGASVERGAVLVTVEPVEPAEAAA